MSSQLPAGLASVETLYSIRAAWLDTTSWTKFMCGLLNLSQGLVAISLH